MKTADLPLHVETRGSGEPLVFLHGFGGSSFTWRHWIGPLSREYRVILVDLKGWGASPAPRDDRYGPGDNAELVHRLIRREGLERVTLIGHSYGGGVALLTALRLLDEGEGRLARLVSVAGAAYEQKIPPVMSMARGHFVGNLALKLAPMEWLIRKILQSIYYDPSRITETQVRAYAAPLKRPDTRHAVLAAAARLVPPDLPAVVARYPELDVPALLLWGAQDPAVPVSIGERLAGDLPDARLVVLDECGHLLPEERPRESLRVLRDFLRETG